MSNYVIKNGAGDVIAWGAASAEDFSGGVPEGLEWVELSYEPQGGSVEAWRISRGAFFDRFGAEKLPILASTDPLVQAIVTDCTVRQYLDLRGRAAAIEAALDVLVAKGFAIDKAAILNTKPADAERYTP